MWERGADQSTIYPWIIFRLNNVNYALNSKEVTSIAIMPHDYNKIPEAPPYMRGIYQQRGSSVPLMDLRKLFGIQSMDEIKDDFFKMLRTRKEEHLHWARELENSVVNGKEFALTDDPHQCQFGKWLDSYETDNSAVKHNMNKIIKPHEKLHRAARDIKNFETISDEQVKKENIKNTIRLVKTKYVPQILQLLDEMEIILKESIREMVLVLGEEEQAVGLIVDEVIGVEVLSPICDEKEFNKFYQTKYITGVCKNGHGLILLLDEGYFLNLRVTA